MAEEFSPSSQNPSHVINKNCTGKDEVYTLELPSRHSKRGLTYVPLDNSLTNVTYNIDKTNAYHKTDNYMTHCTNTESLVKDSIVLGVTPQKGVPVPCIQNKSNSDIISSLYSPACKSSFNCKIIHQNMQICANKGEQLEIFLIEEKPCILCLTEHGLTSDEIKMFNIEGYSLISSFCRNNYKGGGVAIYAINRLIMEEYMTQDKIMHAQEKNFELAIARVQEYQLVVITLYRSPTGNLDTFFDLITTILQKDYLANKQIVICGDLNIDVLKEDRNKKRLVNTLSALGLRLTISSPTRTVTTKTYCSSTAIDNIITNIHTDLYKSSVIISAISDHDAQLIELFPQDMVLAERKDIKRRSSKLSKFRDFSRKNILKFYRRLQTEKWEYVYSESKADYIYKAFITTVLNHYKDSFPHRKVRVKAKINPRWISRVIIKQRNVVRTLASKHKISKTQGSQIKLREAKSLYRELIGKAKAQSVKQHIQNSQNKGKAIWGVINRDRPHTSSNIKESRPMKICHNNEIVENPKVVANIFNKYFVEVAGKLFTEHNHNNNVFKPIKEFGHNSVLQTLNEQNILRYLRRIKNKKSSGPDTIPAYIIKQCAAPLAAPLTYIINASLSTGIFPVDLKMAKVKPLYKKGDNLNVENFRPVSNLDVFSKIYEMAVSDIVDMHMGGNNLYAQGQHGFRKNHSTNTAIAEFIDTVLEAIDKQKHVLAIFMDLSRAFDSVDYQILISKLYSYGFKGSILQWFFSYLHGRKQYVTIRNETNSTEVCSEKYDMNMGVPQGSIIGPTLFNIHINDLPSSLSSMPNCRILLYADDSTAILKNADLEELEFEGFLAISEVQQWLEANKLILNLNKTNCILFQNKCKPYVEINIQSNDGSIINQITSTKFLGIHIDEFLNWTTHVDYLSKKISSSLFVLRRLKIYDDRDILLTAYHSLIGSHLNYGIIAWGNSSKGNNKRLFTLQKKAIRLINGLGNKQSCRGHFKTSNIMTLSSMYMYSTIIYHVSHKSNRPRNYNVHEYNTRHKKDVYMVSHRRTLYEKSPTYAGGVLYNKLPVDIKNVEDKNLFKRVLKTYFTDSEYYSVNDFLHQ